MATICKTTKEKQQRQEAIGELRKELKPGDTLYTKLIHCARSGMYRTMDVFIIRENEPRRITWSVCKATRNRYDQGHEGLGIGGCGMDMGFAVVYELSHVLFPEGFECTGDRGEGREYCPSCDHSNGDRNYSKGHHHGDGGYALRQRWL